MVVNGDCFCDGDSSVYGGNGHIETGSRDSVHRIVICPHESDSMIL